MSNNRKLDADQLATELCDMAYAHGWRLTYKLEKLSCPDCENQNCPYPQVTQRDIDEALGNPSECPECGIYDDQVRTEEEQAVLDACWQIPLIELQSSGNWYGWAAPIGKAVMAWRRAKRDK